MASKRAISTAFAAVVLTPFGAQAGGDGLGVVSSLTTGDPTLSPRAARSPGNDQAALSAGFEYIRAPIVRVFQTPDGEETEALLTDVGAVRLAGMWSPSRRVAIGLDLPLIVGASGAIGGGGPAAGTAQLCASVGLVGDSTQSAWLGVTPFFMVPLGKSERWLRDHSPGAGLLVHGGADSARWL